MYKRDIYLDIDDNLNNYIKSVELDSNSRVWHFHLTVDYEPLDLTGKSVQFRAEKPDKTNVLNDCKIVDAEKGVVEVKLTRQVNAIPGHVKCLLKIIGDEGFVLKTKTFVVDVSKTLSDDAIVSSDEFGTLEAALGKVQDIDNRFAQTNAQLSEKLDKNGIVSMANMGQDVKEAMTGGSVAVVGKNTVLTENIVDKQITPEKTNFIDNMINFELERGSIDCGMDDNSQPHTRLRCCGFIKNDNKMYILRKNSDFLIGVSTYDGNVYDGVDYGWIDRDVIEIKKGKNLRFNVRKRDNGEITDEDLKIAQASIEVRYEFLVASKGEVSKLSEVVEENSNKIEKIVDKQITPEKTNFIDNMINFELERGSLDCGMDDNSQPNTRLRCRGFIENENKMYILRKNSDFLIGVSTYDGNIYDGVDLGWLDRDVIEIEKGKNLRFNIRKRDNGEITDEDLKIAQASIEVRYEFLVASKGEVSKLSEVVEENSNKIENVMVINELVPKREEYELGGMESGNGVISSTRVRTRDFIEVNAGDLIKFNLDGSKFKYGVNLYDKNKKWNGVDYGWMNCPKFELEQTGYVKIVLKYDDSRVITNIASDEITDTPISIVTDFRTQVFNELNIIKMYVEELEADAFEIGTIAGNTPTTSSTRARLKDYIRMASGDIVHFNKGADGFRWGISISNLDGEWNGIDYGWLSQKQFVIEQECLVKFVLTYGDNRNIDGTNIHELCNKAFTIEKNMNKHILGELESLKNKNKDKEEDLIKNIAMSSINVEYGRIKDASYVFVRIPKILNDGSTIVPKVVLTSDDGSISGAKCSTLDYSRKHNSIFTVNAGLFDMSKHEPVGQLIIDGVSLINEPMTDDNGVPISDTECYPLAIDKDWNLTTYPRNTDTAEMLRDGVRYAVTAWGKLVDNFEICYDDINAEIVHNRYRYIRQSIGQFQNGDYCVCSVDMTRGNVENEAGLKYEDLAQIFVDKGVKFAYSLDGGGSTQTVLGKRQLNPIYEGASGRRVPTVITFEIA